jgi:hypothetical protein
VATEAPVDVDQFLSGLTLLRGSHNPDSKFCVMEAVAYVAGETWTDSPECASTPIASIMRRINDVMTDDERQVLKPYIPRLVGTAASSAIETKRRYMATDWCARVSAPRSLRRIGLIEEAERLEQLAEIINTETFEAARPAMRSAADAAYKFRSERRAKLEAKLRNLLVERGAVAAVVAAAEAAEAAEAAAEAAAVAAEAAAVAAAAVAEAAEAAEAAAAEAAADPAFLARIADLIKDKPYWDVYAAVRAELRERPIYGEALKAVRAELFASALELVDRMIEVA